MIKYDNYNHHCDYTWCVTVFYAQQLYRQVLLRARISYDDSVCLSVRPSVRHNPVSNQARVR